MYPSKYSAKLPFRNWYAAYANENCANYYSAFLVLASKKLREKSDAWFILILLKIGVVCCSFCYFLLLFVFLIISLLLLRATQMLLE